MKKLSLLLLASLMVNSSSLLAAENLQMPQFAVGLCGDRADQSIEITGYNQTVFPNLHLSLPHEIQGEMILSNTAIDYPGTSMPNIMSVTFNSATSAQCQLNVTYDTNGNPTLTITSASGANDDCGKIHLQPGTQEYDWLFPSDC